MKVAFATTDGININEHFGRAGMFAVYEITKSGYEFVENRKFAEGRDKAVEKTRDMGAEHDMAVRTKVDRMADCRLIYIEEIGGPSAARLSRCGIMPMKIMEDLSIENNLHKLYGTIKGTPPLWLRKALEQK